MTGPPVAVQDLLDAMEAATCAVDHDGVIVAVNSAWRQAGDGSADGDASGHAVGADYLAVCDAAPAAPRRSGDPDGAAHDDELADAVDVGAGLRAVLSGASVRHLRTYACHSPDEQRWCTVRIEALATSTGAGALVRHDDVTAVRADERALRHRGLHDDLTGLPNRVLLGDRLAQALAESRRTGGHVAVALVDLDGFARVNERLGHAQGDALLVAVAGRLRQQVRDSDVLARYVGDAFAVLWRDLRTVHDAAPLVDRLGEALQEPFDLGGARVVVTASTGVALARPGQTGGDVLVEADAALRTAKRHARGRVHAAADELLAVAQARAVTAEDLQGALDAEELVLHYQPVVDLASGRPVGVEALVRWQHPVRGLLRPDLFIPVAEESGLVVPLGRWALAQACRDAAGLTGAAAGLDVAVNLSARQLGEPAVIRHVREALRDSGLPPGRLVLEVTETTVVQDEQAAELALEELAALGVRLAVDDFGTGWSSLLYLRRYPFTVLKIDRTFVGGIGRSRDDEAICTSVISLAKAVGATCIAEGVETAEQYAVLRAGGCHLGQGFLWSPAVPLGQLDEALAACVRVAPAPARPRRRRGPEADPLDPSTARRIGRLHAAGASLLTIAGVLNTEHVPHPASVRWTAAAVARYLAAGTGAPGTGTA